MTHKQYLRKLKKLKNLRSFSPEMLDDLSQERMESLEDHLDHDWIDNYRKEHRILKNEFRWEEIPFDIMKTYAAMDALVTFKLFEKFIKIKENEKLAWVYKNLLVAHTRVYHTLKKMPNGEDSRIGLVKNIMQFDPYRRWHLLDWIVCRITNSIYNDMAIGYLKDGRINVNYPFFAQLRFEYKEAAGATDFFGLNYFPH